MKVSDRIAFAEKNLTLAGGKRWSLKGREWIRDEFWLPADGYKLWKSQDPDAEQPCDDCIGRIGDFVERPGDNPTADCECGGLVAEPIIITILNIERQDGKTTNTMAWALASLCKDRNRRFAFIAASEDQAETLFREHYVAAIDNNPAIAKLCQTRRMRIEVPKKKNTFEAMATAHRSVTGRGRTHIIIDEGRDIPARVVAALIPATFAQSGRECPYGHVRLHLEEADGVTKCTACDAELEPWYARIVITSSSGVVDGGETDWLYELIQQQRRDPHKNVHLFQSETSLNPAKDETITSTYEEAFGNLESMKSYVAAESGNRWTKKHEDFMSQSEVKRVVDNRLTNEEGTDARCVGFLDTSISVDKTSLVILAEDEDNCAEPWDAFYVSRIDVWDPKNAQEGVVDDRDVRQHLSEILPLYPNLKVLPVDTRGMRWAIALIKWAKREGYSWARCLRDWNKHDHEEQSGFGILETKIRQGKIRLPHNEAMLAEFAGLIRKDATDTRQSRVVDRNRRKSHKDILSALACCCYLAHQEYLTGGTAGTFSTINRKLGRGRRLLPRLGLDDL